MLVTGVDIVEIDRVARVHSRYGERFLRRIYTAGEIAYCRGRAPQLASRFAAKEAVMKLLGTGVRGVGWRDIEVVRKRGQAPSIRLSGNPPVCHYDCAISFQAVFSAKPAEGSRSKLDTYSLMKSRGALISRR